MNAKKSKIISEPESHNEILVGSGESIQHSRLHVIDTFR